MGSVNQLLFEWGNGMERIYCFPPVAQEDAQTLILGSMPSVQSLTQGFYYAHPRNAFWRIMADIWQCPPPETVEEKKQLMTEHRLALWDSIHSCCRPGSLDSSIRAVQANDFASLFDRCPHISRICFNGRTAYAQFAAHAGQFLKGRQGLLLPSTSPAYTMKYEEKFRIWQDAILHGKGAEV